jgi:protein-disulfide isomerase
MSSAEGSDPDLTRKERREQARAQRKALEQAELASAARRKRLIQLGVVIGVVVAIIVVIAVATSGGGSKKVATEGPRANQEVAAVTSLLRGIPQSANTLGDPKAPLTMQYFGDLECPVCQAFTLGVIPTLVSKYVRTGKLKIEYRSLETATREPETFKTQQVAALAAGKQHHMWDYIELFYHEQGTEDSGYVTEGYLQKLAQQVPGLNLAAWSGARNEPAFSAEVTSDQQAATQAGFTGTPSFLLGKSDSLQPFQPSSFSEPAPYLTAIDKLLAS